MRALRGFLLLVSLTAGMGCARDPVASFCEALDSCEQSPYIPHVSVALCEERFNAFLESKPPYVADCYLDLLGECALAESCLIDCPNRGKVCE